MSDERRDDETGRALGSAIEGQTVRETPYAASRLARRIDRPAARGWTYALPVAAALAFFVAMGWFFARGPQGVATPDTSPTPAISATTGPAPTASPTAVPTASAADAVRVYFARDQLPPVGAMVPALASFATLPPAERISARVRALWDVRPTSTVPPPSAGVANVFGPHVGGASLRDVTTTIAGDTATVVIDAGTWDSLSSAETVAVVAQLVYTITEEPGIRRAAIREPGKDHAVIGNGILKDPLSREEVTGYTVTVDQRIVAEDQEVPATATATASNDVVAPGLGRVAIELRGNPAPAGGFWSPRFIAELQPNDESLAPPKFVQGKWVLLLTLPGATHGAPIQQISGGPILEVRQAQSNVGAAYSIGLTDARPWRVSVERGSAAGTMRLLVDIGGHPSAVANGTAVYSPRPGSTVSRSFTVSGAARAFEATVSWRVRDSAGREVAKGFTNASVGTSSVWGTFTTQIELPATVSGNVTLDVFQASPRDGSDTNKVEIPLTIR